MTIIRKKVHNEQKVMLEGYLTSVYIFFRNFVLLFKMRNMNSYLNLNIVSDTMTKHHLIFHL